MSKESYDLQKTEILAALQRLDDKLSIDEKLFLQNNTTDSLREFSRIQQQETGMEKFSFRFVLWNLIFWLQIFFSSLSTVSEQNLSKILKWNQLWCHHLFDFIIIYLSSLYSRAEFPFLSFHFFCHGQFRTIFLLPLRVSVNYHLILFLIQSNFYTFLLQLKKLLSCHYLSSSYYRFLLLLLLNDNLFKQHNALSLSMSRSY